MTGEPTVSRIYVQIAVTGAVSDGELSHRILRHHEQRVERFREALLRDEPGLEPDTATRRTEILLATLNGLAFRAALDPSFDFETYARAAAG